MIKVLWPETNKRAVFEPEPASLSWEPFSPHDRPTCHSTAILHPSAGLQYGDNRNAHTAGPIRSCPGPGDPHRLRTLEHNRVSIDVAVELCKHSVHRHRTCAAPSLSSCATLRGLNALRLRSVNLQCKGGNRPAKSLVLLMHPLQLPIDPSPSHCLRQR